MWHAPSAQYADMIKTDHEVRQMIFKHSKEMGMAIHNILFYYSNDSLKLDLYTTKAGVVFGKGGSNIALIASKVAKIIKLPEHSIQINPISIIQPALDPSVIGSLIAGDMERKKPYNKSMRMAAADAMNAGALGVRIECAGRLNGVEIARNTSYSEGQVPRNTMKANIYYSLTEANTDSGTCGIKVWVNLKEDMKINQSTSKSHMPQSQNYRSNVKGVR
jgi:small subunit ribosomal protein S3